MFDDFFCSSFFSFPGALLVLRLDRPIDDALSASLKRVRGSPRISDKETPGTAAVLTNFSKDTAHKSRPQYRAHCGAVNLRP